MLGGAEVGAGLVDRGVDLGELDVGIGLGDFGQLGVHPVLDVDVGRLLGLADLEADHGAVVQAREAARLGRALADVGDVGEADEAAAAGGDGHGPQLVDRLGRAEDADGLFAAADLHAAAGRVLLEGHQGVVDLGRGQAPRRQLVGIEDDVDLARHAADPRDLRDPADGLEVAGDLVVDVPGKLLVRHRRRFDRIGDDRECVVDLDPGDGRLVDVARQHLAGLVDLGADFVGLLLKVLAHFELDGRRRNALGNNRLDVLDPGDARHGVFDRPGDLGLHFPRRGAALGHRDGDNRELDVRELFNRQPRIGDHAGDQQADEQQGDRNRVADRPGRDREAGAPALMLAHLALAAGCGAAAFGAAAAPASTGFTRSPSSRKEAAFWTTREPAGGPFTI